MKRGHGERTKLGRWEVLRIGRDAEHGRNGETVIVFHSNIKKLTLRFFFRPSSVLLSAIGCFLP